MYENNLVTLNDNIVSSFKSCDVIKIHVIFNNIGKRDQLPRLLKRRQLSYNLWERLPNHCL